VIARVALGNDCAVGVGIGWSDAIAWESPKDTVSVGRGLVSAQSERKNRYDGIVQWCSAAMDGMEWNGDGGDVL
jgi:hypothetical protein